MTEGYRLIPRAIDTSAYEVIFERPHALGSAYRVSILVTGIGVAFGLGTNVCMAYAISRKGFRFASVLSLIVVFTMVFNAGVVPSYIWITRYLRLKDTMWALILPLVVNGWWIVIVRTFFGQLPDELFDSARIDGASEFRILTSIALPLSTPIIATIGLLISLVYWNDWFNALLFVDSERLVPLQYMLWRAVANIEAMVSQGAQFASSERIDVPTESVRMAMTILAAGPMLFIFPFFQRYFARGITAGALKG